MAIFGKRSKRFDRLHYVTASVVALCAAASFNAPAFSQTLNDLDAARREQAILAARAGEYTEPLATLESLRAQYPENVPLTHDLATVFAWADNHARAVALADQLAPEDAPRYTQLAVAKSARNVQRFDFAATWYDAALANDSDDIDALSGRLLTAGDARDAATVRQLIETIGSEAESNQSLALARAYGLGQIGESLPALRAYDAVLDSEPGQTEALRGKALVLRSMLLPTQALELAAEYPGILSDEEIERLESDQAAIRLRLLARTPYPAPAIYEGRDSSLALIDQQISMTTTTAGRNALLLDRVVALSDANDAEAAIAQFEALPPDVNLDQIYVLAAAAKAYLQNRRPAEALTLLMRAHELDPTEIETKFSLVYAWMDLERYDEAYALTQELTASLPMANQLVGSAVVKGNEERIRAELLAGIAEAYGDQLDAAQSRFESLLRAAPNNGNLRHELANVYRWRGWLDRSMNQYRQVLTSNDDMLGAELGFAHAQIDSRDYAEVETKLAEVASTYGREPGVQRLVERWEIHKERELIVTASTGDSTGPVSGSDHYTLDARWYTAPMAYRYRAFVATHDAYAEYPEGNSRRRRFGAGIEYRAPRFTLTGMVSGSRRNGDAGVAGQVDYRLSDLWSVGGGLAWNSDNVQLRAHRLSIESDRAYAQARFAPNESASVSFGLEESSYSDGNSQQSVYADGRYRLINHPRSKLEANGTVSLGRSDTSNVPYFSPTSGRSVMAGLTHQFRILRRYDRELTQHVSVGTGRYAQAGFDSGSTWAVRYRLELSVNQRLTVAVGAERLGQFYDGLREHSTVGTVEVTGRF